MADQAVNAQTTSAGTLYERTVRGATFATGSALASFAPEPFIVPTGFISVGGFGFQAVSDQVVTLTLRTYTAQRTVFVDLGTVVLTTPGTAQGAVAAPFNQFIGSETEILVTNASGNIATITCTVLVRG